MKTTAVLFFNIEIMLCMFAGMIFSPYSSFVQTIPSLSKSCNKYPNTHIRKRHISRYLIATCFALYSANLGHIHTVHCVRSRTTSPLVYVVWDCVYTLEEFVCNFARITHHKQLPSNSNPNQQNILF